MPRLRSVVIASVSSCLFASFVVAVAAPSVASRPAQHTGHKGAKPAPVRDLASYVDGNTITVDWTNPSSDFHRVLARYRQGSSAPTISSGQAVHLDSAHAHSATLRGLAADTTYSVSVWTKSAGKTSDRRAATFTTDDADHGNGTYVGAVTDSTGAPLAHAEITLLNYFGQAEFDTTTDSAGSVTRVLPVGNWIAEVDGSHATGGNSDATGYAGSYDLFEIRSGQQTTRPPLALQPGAALTGRATDHLGNPLRGVTVYAVPPNPYAMQDTGGGGGLSISFAAGDLTMPTAVSAADGSYTLRGLPAGAEQVCVDPAVHKVTGGSAGAAAGYLSRCLSDTVDLAAGVHSSMPDIQLHAGTGGALAGQVQTPSGKVAPGVFVEVFKKNGAGAFVETDATGRYFAGGLTAGNYQVCFIPVALTTASRTGFRQVCTTKPVVIAASKTITLNKTLQHGGAVTGTVTGPDGHPLDGVQVYAGSGESFGVTDSRGHYTIGGLESRRYRICFDTATKLPPAGSTGAKPACLSDKIRVVTGRIRTGGDIKLATAGAVTGVLTRSDGTPVSDAIVDIEPDHFTRTSFGGDGATDADGRYVIGNLPAGHYTACFMVSDDAGNTRTACDQSVVVVEGQFTDDVSKTLPPMGTVAVTTQDTDANPVAGVDVVVLRTCTSDGGANCDHVATFGTQTPVRVVATGMTSAEGIVSYSLVKPGNYAVCMLAFYASATFDTPSTGYADACAGTTFDVTVTADATTTVTKKLRLGGAITGKVTDSAGHPIRGALVHVSNSAADDFSPLFPFGLPNDPMQYSKTAADGTYRIRSVAAGGQTVCVDTSHAKGGASKAGYLDQCIGGDPGVPTGGTPLEVKAGKGTTAPDLALTSASGISGTITATGKLGFADVIVFDSSGSIVDTDDTSSSGHYRVTGLRAGKYRVCVADKHDSRCYVNARWTHHKPPAKAKRVATTAGAISAGIDVKLHD